MADVRQNGDVSLDDLVDEFEEARAAGEADFESFLPPSNHPDYGDILVELIRVELEFGRKSDQRPALADYRERFRDVLNDPARFAPIAFEEFRLRRVAGERCTREEYRDQYDIVTDAWPDLPVGQPSDNGDASASWLRELSQVDPVSANRIAGATRQLPKIGDRFLDFELVGELGRGAFGRAYLARQGDLANRFVALKVTAQVTEEPQRLAQLQHTNIVPIYSLHQQGSLQAVCMPFLGPNTLADVLQTFQANRSIPLSGRALVSTMAARQASTVVRESTVGQVSNLPSEKEPADKPAPQAGSETLQRLDRMSYLDAATWIVARLASGLAHAHEHGIVHRDLKPANVLLTDDGEPLILDFNLSSQSSAVGSSAALVGGTLPYMAPEHIVALQQGSEVGPAADIYSLGVILFEMLTGELPYATHRGSFEQVTVRMLEDRKHPAPSARERNDTVSTDLATIIAKCLKSSPQDRYQTARELQDDLERHLDQLPLAHAPNRSIGERTAKWCRRHPRLMSTASAVTIASVVVVALLLAWMTRGRIIARNEASKQATQFLERVAEARTALNIPGLDQGTLHEAVAAAEEAASLYDLLGDAELDHHENFRLVSRSEQEQLRQHCAELLYLLSSGKALLGRRSEENSEREQLYDQALRTNSLASSLLENEGAAKAILLQRSRLLKAAGQEEEATELRGRAESLSGATELDRYLLANESSQNHDYQAAIELLEALLCDKPQDYSSWFGLGSAHFGTGQFAKAEGCYTTCIALWPQLHLAYFMRGVSRLNQQSFGEAQQDFDVVLSLRPDYAAALVNRALAYRGLGETEKAITDLTAALDEGATETRIYFIRASLKAEEGDTSGAESDRAEGLRRTPSDELSWIARGIAKLKDDPEGALDDFQQALRINPRSTIALQNIAHALSERLQRNEEAIAVMNKLVDAAPHDQLTRANRGVLLARLGREAEAVADAQAAVMGTPSPAIVYRVACIYALLVDDESRNLQKEAVQWLGKALRAQPSLVATALRDPDLTSLRDDPTFRRLISAAHVLQQEASRDK